VPLCARLTVLCTSSRHSQPAVPCKSMPTNLGTFSDDNNLQCGKRRAAHRVGLSEIRVIKRTTAQSHRAPAPRAAPHRSTRAVSRSACRRGVGRPDGPGRDGPHWTRSGSAARSQRPRAAAGVAMCLKKLKCLTLLLGGLGWPRKCRSADPSARRPVGPVWTFNCCCPAAAGQLQLRQLFWQ
jgi:hypothetical protein